MEISISTKLEKIIEEKGNKIKKIIHLSKNSAIVTCTNKLIYHIECDKGEIICKEISIEEALQYKIVDSYDI